MSILTIYVPLSHVLSRDRPRHLMQITLHTTKDFQLASAHNIHTPRLSTQQLNLPSLYTVIGNQTDRLFMAVFTTPTEITLFPGGR